MKKTKKLLALVLTLIMVLASSPLAIATDKETDPIENCLNLSLELLIKTSSSYIIPNAGTLYDGFIVPKEAIWNVYNEVTEILEEKYSNANLLVPSAVFQIKPNTNYLSENPEKTKEITDTIISGISRIDKIIEDNNMETILDTSVFVNTIYRIGFEYTLEDMMDIAMLTMGKETVDPSASLYSFFEYTFDLPLFSEDKKDEGKLHELVYGHLTQENFDSATTPAVIYFAKIYNCMKENHILETATDNGDGTHTGVCSFCTQETTEEHKYEKGICVLCDAADETYNEENNTDSNVSDDSNNAENDEKNLLDKLLDSLSDLIKGNYKGEDLIQVIINMVKILFDLFEKAF